MVKHISDRVGVMYLGKMMELATSSELYESPLHPYTQALLSAIPIPDPKIEKLRQRIKLQGELSTPINPRPGCRFASRCRYAVEKCSNEDPIFREVKKDHFVACHIVESTL